MAEPTTTEAKLVAVMEQLAALQQQQAATAPIRKIDFGEYHERQTKDFPKFTRDSWSNGIRLDDEALCSNGFAEAVTLFNKIDREGTYLDGLVYVTFRDQGAGRQSVHVDWHNKTPDMRNAMLRKKADFTEIIRAIVAVQEGERVEEKLVEEEKKVRRESYMGGSKAYREAKAAADARAANG